LPSQQKLITEAILWHNAKSIRPAHAYQCAVLTHSSASLLINVNYPADVQLNVELPLPSASTYLQTSENTKWRVSESRHKTDNIPKCVKYEYNVHLMYSGTSVAERLSSRTNRFPNLKPKQKTHRFPNRQTGNHLPLTPSTLLRTDILSIYCVYSFCLRFYAFSLFLYTILCMKYCYKGLNKQPCGVRERIIHFTLILMGKWFRFSNSL
jgi:hypothetical protein